MNLHNRIVGNKFFAPDDPPGNPTIDHMRTEITKAQNDAKIAAEELANAKKQLEILQLEKMSEQERLKHENKTLSSELTNYKSKVESLTPLEAKLNDLSNFLTSSYEQKLAEVPETLRDKVKLLSFVDGDPRISLQKLETAISMFKSDDVIVGKPTTPPSSDPSNHKAPEGSKVDPKTIGWSGVFKTDWRTSSKGSL